MPVPFYFIFLSSIETIVFSVIFYYFLDKYHIILIMISGLLERILILMFVYIADYKTTMIGENKNYVMKFPGPKQLLGIWQINVTIIVSTFVETMKQLEADLKNSVVIYDNNPILNWCLVNGQAKVDITGNILSCKLNFKYKRIDGAFALIIAYAVLNRFKKDYETMIS